MGRVLKIEQIEQVLPALRKGKKLVFTNGCFDILHIGHIRYLQEARALGDLLFIAVNADKSVKELKGPSRPVQNENDRAEILAALACVDFVSIFEEKTAERIVGLVKPEIYVKGGDWTEDKIIEAPIVRANGGRVQSLQFVPGHSTSSIIDKIHKL
jgi:rfaE bifunctional protein nucleotidyltransferase chain/domain